MMLISKDPKVLDKIRNKYRKDFFTKLNFDFKKSRKLLDVGCGDGGDGDYLQKRYKIKYVGTDIYKDANYPSKNKFKLASILDLPFKESSFDYLFVHDVIHHIDEKEQSFKKLKKGLLELKRVCKDDGHIIICEGNRYNPIGFFHNVIYRGHNHLSYASFKNLVNTVFQSESVVFKNFELHVYPPSFLGLFRIYEYFMDNISPRRFRSYNVAIIKKNES